MDNQKTSKKQKDSSKKSKPIVLTRHKVLNRQILRKDVLRKILMDSLLTGDFETLEDVIVTQIRLSNKVQFSRQSKLGRQTLYDLLEGKRDFNPTIKTLSSLLKAIAA